MLEGDGVATLYVVVLRGNLQRSVSVTFSTIPGTAAGEVITLAICTFLVEASSTCTNEDQQLRIFHVIKICILHNYVYIFYFSFKDHGGLFSFFSIIDPPFYTKHIT